MRKFASTSAAAELASVARERGSSDDIAVVVPWLQNTRAMHIHGHSGESHAVRTARLGDGEKLGFLLLRRVHLRGWVMKTQRQEEVRCLLQA